MLIYCITMNKKFFEYIYLKSELTSEIILIIKLEYNWLEKELQFNIKKEELEIIVDQQIFSSDVLPYVISDWLNKNLTNVYFANEDGIIISEIVLGGT